MTEEVQRLISFFDFAEFGIGVLKIENGDRHYVYCSTSFENILGVQPGELLGKKCDHQTGAITNKNTLIQFKEAILSNQPILNDMFEYDSKGSVVLTRNMFLPLSFGGNQYALQVVDLVGITKSFQDKEQLNRLAPQDLAKSFEKKIAWLAQTNIYELIETRPGEASESDSENKVKMAFNIIDSFRQQLHTLKETGLPISV